MKRFLTIVLLLIVIVAVAYVALNRTDGTAG
ncbi:MAG: hypothetical protein QOG17_1846, partial [Gammaproteobacteria bacterium]|nr:hypothetical protein [Gammaproteobacteria bacterium]